MNRYGDIVISRGEDSVRVWREDGNHAVNPELIKGLTDKEIVETLGDTLPCTWCSSDLNNTGIGGRKFAGVYCPDCWDQFKKENNRVCRVCRKPMYGCYC